MIRLLEREKLVDLSRAPGRAGTAVGEIESVNIGRREIRRIFCADQGGLD